MSTGRTSTISGPAGDPMIEFRKVSKTYPGSDNPVVTDLSFEVPEGEICVLVGPSGCGKTTTMRMVNRLIEITDGEILINGEPNTAMSATRLRRNIGYAIQQIGLFPHRTIADNIGTVPHLLGWDRGRIRDRVDELLELVGLSPEEYRGRYPAELSGGQQQRVGVARALAADPPIMLMDEPFGAVDPITRENILSKPDSEFVASFVGTDRILKRLSLVRVGDIRLEPANGEAEDLPRIDGNLNVRDALSEIIGSGSTKGVVERGGEKGLLTLDTIEKLSRARDDSCG